MGERIRLFEAAEGRHGALGIALPEGPDGGYAG
jgi:hypothetical protein